jgi:hypothetical protein
MLMISTPEHLLFLVSVAMVVALFIVGEMLERKRTERAIPIPTDEQRAASAIRHLPRASRDAWRARGLPAETMDRIDID